MAFIYTIGLQKGGVAKTTTALHLAYAARALGRRVLVVDMDTQGSASILLTRDGAIAIRRDLGGAGAETLFDAVGQAAPMATDSGVDLLVGHQALEKLDIPYSEPENIQKAMQQREAIKALPYDLIVIDTPPAIGVRQVIPLLWADVVIAPTEPSGLSIAGLATFTRTVEQIKQLTKRPVVQWNIVTRYQRNSRKQKELLEGVESEGRPALEKPYLSNRVAVADALSAGIPVWEYATADKQLREEWRSLMVQLLRPMLQHTSRRSTVRVEEKEMA